MMGRGGDTWGDSSCISKVKPMILSDRLDVRTYSFVLGSWKDRDQFSHSENSTSRERRPETQFEACYSCHFFFNWASFTQDFICKIHTC